MIQIRCWECDIYFFICRSCYRGHRYCGEACQVKGYRKRHREAQRRYRKKMGKKNLNQVEKTRRYLKWLENEKLVRAGVGNVDMDTGVGDKAKTDVVEDFVNASLNIQSLIREDKVSKSKRAVGAEGHCVFCGYKGIIVEKFSSRGYGSRQNDMEYLNAETRIGCVGQFI